MPTAIQIENLSKIYRLGEIGTGTVSRDLERWWTTKIRGKEDPFLKIGQTNNRAVKGESDIVYSLQDIDFEIEQGDAVGIIGRNGAGKSTLLKLLSRVTAPSTGRIHVKGRVASLLEVGTGFHPELTGRENIFLNGAILGMRKKEITRKLDEIIDFSGVERYIDTPVKRYSSGMYVRLAFAVAAHLESEILIVDEVLAVGDAEFQKKCLGKMGDISEGEGRTVLFVSHNMDAISNLCKNSILLANGRLVDFGKSEEIIDYYLKSNNNNSKIDTKESCLRINSIDVHNEKMKITQSIKMNEDVLIKLNIQKISEVSEFGIGLQVYDSKGNSIIHVGTLDKLDWFSEKDLKNNELNLAFNFKNFLLYPDEYLVSVVIVDKFENILAYNNKNTSILVMNDGFVLNRVLNKKHAIYYPQLDINIIND